MSTTSQAYGLIPVYDPSGQTRPTKYNILNNSGTGYGTAIYKGDLVKMHTDGTINISSGTEANLGVFVGCEYIDATGKPVVSPNWVASTPVLSGSQITAYVIDNQSTVFRIGVTANASGYVQAVVGQHADVSNNGTGSATTGLSAASIATAAVNAGTLGNLRIIGYLDGIYDATTNPYPQLLVTLAEVQYAPNAVGV